MSQVVSLRLPDKTAVRLKAIARRSGRSFNDAASMSIEEWLRQEEFADIEFRSFNGERHACLKGALPIWQLIMVAVDYNMDVEQTAAISGSLSVALGPRCTITSRIRPKSMMPSPTTKR